VTNQEEVVMSIQVSTATNVVFKNEPSSIEGDNAEIMRGLLSQKKYINPKFFYDTLGSELFEDITQLPEYYPSRTERSILIDNADDIAEYCGRQCVLVEPGSGSSEKVRLLLDAIRPSAYVPMDIAADFLQRSATRLGGEFPWLNIQAISADFSDEDYFEHQLPEGKRVVFYPGSTLGNMTPPQAQIFLSGLRRWIGSAGGVLIGIDQHKSQAVLEAAYNDRQGVTAQFNLNALRVVNRLMPANFDENNFSHQAFYNQQLQRIEMHLVSNKDQIVRVADKSISVAEGETIHTENSYKYSQSTFEALASRSGFTLQKTWSDERQYFALHYLTVKA